MSNEDKNERGEDLYPSQIGFSPEQRPECGVTENGCDTTEKDKTQTLQNSGGGDELISQTQKSETDIDMSEVERGLKEETKPRLTVKNFAAEMSYKQRLSVAAQAVRSVCGEIDENDFFAILNNAVSENSSERIDFEKIALPCDTEQSLTLSKRNNIYLAGVIFYILSGGKYSLDVWRECAVPYAKTQIAALKNEIKNFNKAANGYLSATEAETMSSFANNLALGIKRKDVAAVVENDGEVGQVKLFELLWEVLVTKYSNYRPKSWLQSIEEYLGKEHNRVCSSSVNFKDAEIYSVSFEGKLDKPAHTNCEDYSYCYAFDDGGWLAVCADGVGSSVNSSIGSMATLVLKDVLKEKLKPYVVVSKFFGGEKRKPVAKNEEYWAELMSYFRFNLAGEFYKKWFSYLCDYEEDKGKTPNPADYATTLQFAFGCKKFIACGAVGDGVFFVKKREKTGETERVGGRFINDGVSGVTQTAVFAVPHLKNNPSALHVEFFNPDEVDSIIITSDGAGAALAGDEKTLCGILGELSAVEYKERCENIERLARRCADYNETNFGSGDDTSVSHILLKN